MDQAYDAGADDYLVRPVPPSTMAWRVRALTRRLGAPADEATGGASLSSNEAVRRFSIGGARFDPVSGEVTARGSTVRLTPRQSTILSLLVQNAGQAFPAERLMAVLWDDAESSSVGVVKAHIRNIRRRLSSLPGVDDPIQTVAGRGYRIERHTVRAGLSSAGGRRAGSKTALPSHEDDSERPQPDPPCHDASPLLFAPLDARRHLVAP